MKAYLLVIVILDPPYFFLDLDNHHLLLSLGNRHPRLQIPLLRIRLIHLPVVVPLLVRFESLIT